MNSQEFEARMIEAEQRLERASKAYNRCMGNAIQKFLEREDEQYNDVTKHCVEQRLRVEKLMKEIKEYH